MTPTTAAAVPDAGHDPLLWLEDIHGARALAWVAERNAQSLAALDDGAPFAALRERLLDVLQARDRIPRITRHGDRYYNLWQDETHPRGIWRRTTLAEYRRAEPVWETVLDLDALGAEEGESWVWGGVSRLPPGHSRCLVALSRGGADATVVREFDTGTLRFVDGGYTLPEAKSNVHWRDPDHIFVGTDTGAGSLTESGYPRTVRLWRRGTLLADAPVVFEGEAGDVAANVSVDTTPGHERVWFTRSTDFFHSKTWLQQGAQLLPLDVPDDASIDFLRDKLLLQLRSDLLLGAHTHPAGSLLQADAAAWLRGERHVQALFTPTATRSLDGYTATRDHIVLTVMDNVANRLEAWRRDGADFVPAAMPAMDPTGAPEAALGADGGAAPAVYASLSASALHDPHDAGDPLAESVLIGRTDFTTPDTVLLADLATPSRPAEVLKARQPLFDTDGMRVEQRFATSVDGTRVPYFVVWPRGAAADGANPTLLYGYGGFEISLNPWYSGTFGRAWHERGGVLVVANIRGGGEYGPRWHQAAIKANKHRSHDDFIAVAEDLIAARITAPRHLGIMGGSNGGLLVGAAFTRRPELFNAVVCQVPLLDMRRYHRLLAGASWMGEYGDPDDPADWAAISGYSPYQQLRAGVRYPVVLFTTSTRDDRVHPGHARKMAERMRTLGAMAPAAPVASPRPALPAVAPAPAVPVVMYYENTEGGHGGAADSAQRAHLQALEFSYLWQRLAR